NRLALETVKSGGHDSSSVLGHHRGGDCDNRSGTRYWISPQPLQGFDTIDAGSAVLAQRTCTSATARGRLNGRSTSRRRSPLVVGSNSKSYASPTEITWRASCSTACAGGRSAPSFATARHRAGEEPASNETWSAELFGVMLMKRNRYFTPIF